MSRKFMSFLVVVFCLIGLLSSSFAFAEKPTLTIMYLRHWVPEANEVVQKRAEEWGAAHNINISFDMVSEKDFPFKISIAAENKTGPDLMLMLTSSPILYQDSLLDVSSVANAIMKRNGSFYPANKAQCFNGKRWVSIPWYSVIPTWMYREDLLKEANLKIPETYDDVVTVAKALTKPEQGVYGLGMALSRCRDGILFSQSVLWAFGNQLAAKDGKTILFDSPQTLAGLKYITDLYKVHKVMPQGVTGWDDSSNNKAWAAGNLAMTTNAPSIYYQVKVQDPKQAENTGHALWPKGPAGSAVMMDTYSLAISKYTKNRKLALELLAYLTSDDGYKAYYAAGKGFPGPTLAPFAKLPVFTSDPKIKAVVDMYPLGRVVGWPGPVTKASAEVEAQGVITDMVQRVLVDGLTPQASLEETTKRIKEIYAKYEK